MSACRVEGFDLQDERSGGHELQDKRSGGHECNLLEVHSGSSAVPGKLVATLDGSLAAVGAAADVSGSQSRASKHKKKKDPRAPRRPLSA
jgi:hypothetical protein